MKKSLSYIISLLILLMGLAACGSEDPTPIPPTAVSEEAEVIAEPTAVPTEAPTAEPTIAPTTEPTVEPTAEPEPTAVPTEEPVVEEETAVSNSLTAAQISLDTDALGVEWFATLIPAGSYDASQPPGPKGLPEHVVVTFDNNDPTTRGFGEPIMYIIPVNAYEELWNEADNDSISRAIGSIEQMVTTLPSPAPTSGMPALPYEEVVGFNDIAAQVSRAASNDDSASKSGYRFVGRFGQSPNPVTNWQLRYIYQGFSNDGQYLVSFFYPVRTDALPDETDATTMDEFEADMTGHMNNSIAMLNELETSDWEPDLAVFDEVVASLQIENMPSSGLIGSEWQWVRSERTETTEVDSPADYTLIFNNDGSYNFQADCNSGSGEFTVDGGFFGSMRMEAGISTLAECGESSRSNDMFDFMTAVQSYKLAPGGNELSLVWPAGGGNEIFKKAGDVEMTDSADADMADTVTESTDEALPTTLPAEITAETWQWISFSDPVSGTQPIPEPERYQLTLNDDGSYTVQADCNSGSGSYTVEGSSISFAPAMMSLAACPPDSLADEFMMGLGAAAIYFTQEGDLFFDLIYDSGTMRLTAVTDTNTAEPESDNATTSEGSQITPESIQMDTQGLASSWTWQVVGGAAASEGPGGAPATSSYIMLTFDEMDAETAVSEGGPRLYIFPVESYIAVGGERVENEVLRLQELIDEANGSSSLPIDPMPLLPPPSSFMGRWAQFADLDFGEGTGVRYVSEAINRQSIGPWTNNGTAYYYQGLTEDGRFYISLVWPVRTDSLPDTYEDVPEETVAAATSPETYDAYLIDTQNMLNQLPSNAWEPNLVDLDAMVESLQLYE